MPHPLQELENEPNEWQTSMLKAPCADPGYCCFACFCAPCVIYMQRDNILGEDGKYKCCLGVFPCCQMDLPKIPCLCCEICCCCGLAASANRIFIMQRLQIKPDPCDTVKRNPFLSLENSHLTLFSVHYLLLKYYANCCYICSLFLRRRNCVLY